MTAEEFLKSKGMSNVGHYGLLITNPSKQKMHQIMEEYAKQLLSDYTDRVVDNAEAEPYSQGAVGQCGINKESITNQLELFKKEIEL